MSKRITSPQELLRLKDTFKSETELRGEPKAIQVIVHMGTCGIAAGAREILDQLMNLLIEQQIDTVTLRQTGCIGLCDQEPMFTIKDASGQETLYGKLNESKLRRIVREHILDGKPVTEFVVNV
ncbi:MAG: (2Fe-2S) ferredoxin domain-containing protein [Bradymonadales bacterium]|nr:(2Fe-2S) ferredoxin domain-containing protein [Bradymonadales bacterium]